MNFDPGILVYLIFLAIILYSNHLKKRRQAQARERAARAQTAEALKNEAAAVPVPAAQSRSQPPDLEQWLDTLWGKKKPEPAKVAAPMKKSLHEQRRERELQMPKAAAAEQPRGPEEQSWGPSEAARVMGRRVPIDAARFRTKEDLRRAVVARVVLAPPKSLQ
jgi:hypothetical protein